MNDKKKTENITHMFNCPAHGLEVNVFCFRAFQDENIEQWKKYSVSYNEIHQSTSEKIQFLKDLRKSFVDHNENTN